MIASKTPSGGLAEPVVLAFLVLAAAVLGWLHWKVLPQESAPRPLAFDFVNPMLDAEVGECVAVESESRPEEVTCVRVREPGVVLRPNDLELRLPRFGEMQRRAPYMVCELRYPPTGQGCDVPPVHRDLEVYALGGFGLPMTVPALLESIQPRWVERGGRYRFVYEIQMHRYGRFQQGAHILYVDPEQPVTGIVLRKDLSSQGRGFNVLYTPVACSKK